MELKQQANQEKHYRERSEDKKVMLWVLAYILLAFSITWTIWLVFHSIGPLRPTGLYIGMFGPALSALIVRVLARDGFQDAGLRFHLKQQKRYYLLGYLLIPVLVIGGLLFAIAIGVLHFSSFTALQFLERILLVFIILPIPASLLAFGEEFGWRGYLFIRLARFGTRKAAIITGIVWTLWHTPLLLGYAFTTFPHEWIAIPLYGLLILPVGVLLAWLRVRSASIWPTTLGHAMLNALQFLIPFLLSIHALPNLTSAGWLLSSLPLLICAAYILLNKKSWLPPTE